MSNLENLARKFMAHYLDDTFGGVTPNWFRIGKDLEEFNEELNPDVETSKNILGQTSVKHNGYEVSESVEPYYYAVGETLAEKVEEIANKRLTGSATQTTMVDAIFSVDAEGNVTKISAYKETVSVIPDSIGGDTSGVQIPFTLYHHGDRAKIDNEDWSVDAETGELSYTPS